MGSANPSGRKLQFQEKQDTAIETAPTCPDGEGGESTADIGCGTIDFPPVMQFALGNEFDVLVLESHMPQTTPEESSIHND